MLFRSLTNTMRLALVIFLGLLLGFADEAPAANRPSIDLAVDRVWVGSNCRVKVRVVRQGPGRLPEKLAKFTVLGIQVGKKKYAFTFKEIDPRLVLLRGPGAITFSSPIRVRTKATIVAVVDPKKKLSEASEANNRGRAADLPRKCTVASVNLDWLKVRGLYLRKDRLHVVIAFNSKAAIAAGELGRIGLEIKSKTARGAWSLARVYRQGKAMGKGTKVFNTQLKLKPGARVMVAFKRAKLTKRQAFTLPKPAKKAKGPSGSGGPGIPIMLNRGIAIFKPTSRKVAYRGGPLTVLYSLSAEAPSGYIDFALYRGPDRLNSMRVRYEPPSGSVPAELMLNVRIPRNAYLGGGYYIKASMGGLWGESDRFQIAAFGEGGGPISSGGFEIRVVNPSGVSWPQGSTNMISWRLTGSYPGDPSFIVKLLRGSVPVLTIDSSAAVWQANSRTYTLNWTVPRDLPAGDNYRIQVADRNGPMEDFSDANFTVGGPIVVQGGHGTYHWSRLMTIRYVLPSWASIRAVKISLLNQAGDTVLVFQSRRAVSLGNYVWPVGANTDLNNGDLAVYRGSAGAPLRGTYRIRVEDADDPSVYGLGQPFTIAEPTYSVTLTPIIGRRGGSLSGRPDYEGYNISWSSPELGTNGQVNIKLGYFLSGGAGFARRTYFVIARNRPSTGTMIWHHGEHASGSSYPSDSDLPTWGFVRVVPVGFDDLYTTRGPEVYIDEP